MPAMDALFTELENYEGMNPRYLKVSMVYFACPIIRLRLCRPLTATSQFSKLSKVLKHLIKIPSGEIPRDNEFKFRERAQALVDRWSLILEAPTNEQVSGEAGDSDVRVAAELLENTTLGPEPWEIV